MPVVTELYAAAILKLSDGSVDFTDPGIRFVIKNPWAIGFLDAALGVRDREAPLRLRLLTMFAILETQPAYSRRFLPRAHSLWDVLCVGFNIVRLAVGVVFGTALLMLAKRT